MVREYRHNMMNISEFERKTINDANVPSKWIQYRAILRLVFCAINCLMRHNNETLKRRSCEKYLVHKFQSFSQI
jgi:hypothetical protein